MCGDFLFGTLMCCCLPCISKREGNLDTTTTHNQAEAPRPAKPRSRVHKQKASVPKHIPQPRVSAQQAHRNLLTNLRQPANLKQTAAHHRLRIAFSMPKEHLDPETVAQVVTDLDTVLFSGNLDERIIIDLAEMTATLRGISLPYDLGRKGISKVRIRLNKAMFRMESKEEIWGTIVHEMMHAYLDLTSNWEALTHPHHGFLFERSCGALVERLTLEGFEVRHVV